MCPSSLANAASASNNGTSMVTNATDLNGTMNSNSTGSIVQGTLSQVFFTYFNNTGLDDTNPFAMMYIVIIGTLFTFFSLTGYEAAGHVVNRFQSLSSTL